MDLTGYRQIEATAPRSICIGFGMLEPPLPAQPGTPRVQKRSLTTPLTCPAGAGSYELQKAYMPAGSGAAADSAGHTTLHRPDRLKHSSQGVASDPYAVLLPYLLANLRSAPS